jgi:ATP-dependent Clp protease ATP-binding subunit ClpX
LDKSALKKILTEPKNALIKQYKRLFEYENIHLEVTDEALDYIVDKAVEFKLGGRGLRSICELVMTDAMYEMPGKKGQQEFVLNEEYAREKIEKSKYAYLKVA